MPRGYASVSPDSEVLGSGRRLSHYRILGKLGEGGMGQVYAAEDLTLKRRVALKVLPAGTASDAVTLERFQREAEAIASLNHPNIVTVHSLEESRGLRFLTMELVEGKTLADRIAAGRLELKTFFEVALPLADALARAHDRGVIHRDVKPANVMIGDDGRVKLLDFGLARLRGEASLREATPDSVETVGEGLTGAGAMLGTVPYMSPEQLLGEEVDHRSDVWSLAVVLYEMLAGHRPFRDDAGSESMRAILTGDPPPLEGVPGALERALHKALSKRPEDRHARMGDLEEELRRLRTELESGVGMAVPRLPFDRAPERMAEAAPSCFVAREIELERLRDFLEAALQGSGRVAFVTGDAGCGKTALMGEFARRAQQQLEDLVVAGGICNAHTGIGDPYLPFREALGLLTGDIEARWTAGAITRQQAIRLWEVLPQVIGAILTAGPALVGTLLSGPALLERARLASHTAAWLERLERLVRDGGSGNPQQLDLFEQYTRVVHELTRRRPLLLLIDDLQWADTGSIGLLFHLGRRLRGSRVLVLCAYRPAEVAAGRSGGRHPLEHVVNELKRDFGDCEVPVAETSGREFVEALLDAEPNRLGGSFRRALFRQAGGHALFTVELLRNLREEGGLVRDAAGRWVEAESLDWGRLPMRVEAAIAERIGRLPEDLRRLLTIASVEGAYFTAEVAARIQGVDEATTVRRLSGDLDQRHRLVRAHGLQRRGGQRLSRYAFRHILFQRYLQQRLDAVERTHLHEAVGDALLALHGGEIEPIAVDLAQHFELAGLPARAVTFLLQAGRGAARVSAHEEAISHLTRALELLEPQPGDAERTRREVEILTALGPSLIAIRGYAAPDVKRVYLRSRELCRGLGEEPQRFWAIWGLWVFHNVRADLEESFELAGQLMQLAEPGGESEHLVEAHSALGLSHVERGEMASARHHLERAIDLGVRRSGRAVSPITGEDVEVVSLSFLACALWIEGFPDQAVKRSLEAWELACALRHPFSQAFALNFVNYVRVFRHEPEVVRDRAPELIELAGKRGFPFWHGLGTVCLLWARSYDRHAAPEDQDDLLAKMRDAIDGVAASGARISQTFLLAHLAEAYLRYGRIEKAREALAAAFHMLEATGERHTEAELYRLRGELAAADGVEGGPESADRERRAEHAFRRALAVAREQGARSWELRAAVSLTRLTSSRRGHEKKARADLMAVTEGFTEGYDTPDFKAARALLAELR